MSMSLHGPSFARARKWSSIFMETGTHRGGGLYGAMLAHFEQFHTIEISRELSDEARRNMGVCFGRIHYYVGDSGVLLPQVLTAIRDKCSILLDAHLVADDNLSLAASGDCPLRRELEALAKSYRRDHLIMVDDIDLCGGPKMAGLSLLAVKGLIWNINPGYRFDIVDGVRPKMLLFALPPGFND